MKRISALFLVMMMIFSAVMPTTAFAADTENEVIAELGESGDLTPATVQEETATPLETASTEPEMPVATPTEPPKLLTSPDEQISVTAWGFPMIMTATQSERVTNPHIVYTYSPAILSGAAPIIFTDSTTGMPAYCIDYNRNVPSPESLDGDNDFDPETIFDPATYNGLKCLLLAGYPYETGDGLTAAEAQGCTQLAIWCWTYETMGYGLNAANYTAIPGKEYIYDYFMGLMEAARNQTQPNLGLAATDVTMMKSGDVFTGQTSISTRNLQGGYSLDESKLPEGVTVTGYTGNDGDVLTFTAPLSYAGQSLTLESILAGHDERSALNLFWYDNKNPNQQRMAISVTDTMTIAIETDLSMSFQSIGSIKLIKLSATDEKPLAHAVFGVFNADTDEKITELITDERGEASILLPYGNFYLCELTPPDGFRLSNQQYPVQLDRAEIEVTATNTPTGGSFKLHKTDESGAKLANAIFGVYRASDNEKIAELKTDSTGYAEIALPVADFYLLELTAPEGFQKSDEKIFFTVADNEVTERTVTNTRIPELPKDGYLQIVKIEQGKNNVFLGGAVFGVYNAATDEKVCELTTGTDGKASTALPQGNFYLKELIAPSNYRLVTDEISFTIKPTETVTLTVENPKIPEEPKPGKLVLTKEAEDTGKKLSGAVFGVYSTDDNKKQGEITTDKNGKATIELPAGRFYLLEKTAPQNFQRSDEKVYFRIKSGETTEITVENKAVPTTTPDPEEPKPGKLVLTKEAEDTGKKLSGAVFGVYSAEDNKKQGEITTGRDGKATIELPAGRFYLLEKTAPQGFQKSGDKVYFRIRSGETTEITVENKAVPTTIPDPDKPKTGTLELLKKAEGTGERLSGAVFGVYSVDGNKKQGEITTDKNGMATIELAEGDFYLKELTPPKSFIVEKDKIPFTISVGETVLVEVTNMREAVTIDNSKTPQGNITIPKTGGDFPAMSYTLSALCFTLAAFCGAALLKRRRRMATVK